MGQENVISDMAALRGASRPPMTVAEALVRARDLRGSPEMLLDDKTAKRLIDTLLSAIEVSTCYMKAVRHDIPSFTLLAYDRASHDALQAWCSSAENHGCRPEKVEEARMQLRRWRTRDDLRWPA